MSRFKVKKLPPIRLEDLLKKRRTNLKQFLSSYGIVSYSTLLHKCETMGVSPPSESLFKEILGPAADASSPQEGVVVLDPPKLLKELTGEKILVDESADFHPVEIQVLTVDQEAEIVDEQKSLEETKIFSKRKKEKSTLNKVEV